MAGCSQTASVSSAGGETAAVQTQPKLEILEDQDHSDYSRAAEQKIQMHDAADSRLFSSSNLKVTPEKEYTLMVYIVGSNLESRYGAASKDIDEMKTSGFDFDKNNLIVYTGGSRRWNSSIPNTKNSVIDLSKEEEIMISAQTENTADMGASETLSEFINFCTETYPAKHYGLILWDHGGGPLWGYGSDELFSNDSLILEEMKKAMDSTIFAGEKKLDFVGFDACLMGTLENANLWSSYAGYFVGSEELEAGDGWDYSFLKVVNETDDPKEITSAIVNAYGSYYENNQTEFYAPDATLAAVDLSQVPAAVNAVNALMEKMNQDIGEGYYAELNQARANTKAFGLSAASGKENAYDLIDLKHLAENLSDRYPEETANIINTLSQMVVSESTNIDHTGGLSIYLPGDNSELAGLADELYTEETVLSAPYKNFVNAYKEEWLSGGKNEWTLEPIVVSDDELTLQLSEEQRKNTSAAYYTILLRNSFGGYAMTTCNVRIQPDENGVLHIPADPYLMTAKTDMEESPVPWACLQQETNEKETSYQTLRTYLSTGHEFTDFDINTDELVTITVKNTNGEETTTIQDISSAAGSAWLAGKGSIDVSHYETIIDTGGMSRQPSRDENGNMKPFFEWNSSGYVFYPLSIDNSFEFIMKRASEYEREFICQVCLKDVNGNIHASDYVDLPKKESNAEYADVSTESGTLTFLLSEDAAELTQYTGEDTELQIPEEAEGRPVTVIGRYSFSGNETLESITVPGSVSVIADGAFNGLHNLKSIDLGKGVKTIEMSSFAGCTSLESIVFPEGLEQIGRAAFKNCGLKTVEIPGSVIKIGSIPFSENENMKEITVSGSNKNYKSADGVLFTKDGKVLIQYPTGKTGSYQIPKGTETIGYGAFALAGIDEVTFPETLKSIENDAFFECYKLKSLRLPESLESIGDLAFGEMRFLGSYENGETYFESVYIGENVDYIGTDAFTALNHGKFEVSEKNQKYASLGGFITNKAKDTILCTPMGMDKIIRIPDGITTLTKDIFYTLDEDTEFIVPDSVFRFSERAFPYTVSSSEETGEYTDVYKTVIHCNPGSAAEEYAETYGIACDHNTDPEDMTYELKVTETDEENIVYRLYKKHAVLLRYRKAADQGVLELPAELEGVPVTGLQAPDYDEYNGYSASTNAQILQIPSTIESIDPGFLTDYYNLKEIRTDEENPAYTSIDGILYSKDGKQLICYPSFKEGTEYTVPEGTEEIGENAFNISNLTKINFPDSVVKIGEAAFQSSALTDITFGSGLKEIGKSAFSGCKLKRIDLPEGLERIGDYAFDLSAETEEFRLPDSLKYAGDYCFDVSYDSVFELDTVRIGPNLKLGYNTFQNLKFNAYEVSEENPYYIVKEGSLFSANGKELINVPTNSAGEYHIPEGTETVGYSAFENCDNVTDIYFPASAVSVGGATRKNYTTDEYYYTIHCPEGSEIAKQLDAKGIPWVASE